MKLKDFAYPFDKLWKRVLMHVCIAFGVGLFFIPFVEEVMGYFVVVGWTFLNDTSQAAAHIFIYYKLDERYDWIKDTTKRFVYGLIFHLIATLIVYFPVNVLCFYIVFGYSVTQSMQSLLAAWFIPVGLVVFVMTFAVAGEFLKNWKQSLIDEQKMKAEMMSYKYESLLNQINPHFLFNSFNVLANLVHQNQDLAVRFIHKLSFLYRTVLENKDKDLISLQEELAFIDSYIFLLKIRFENKLQISFDVEGLDENDLIVPMVLQSLIENAIKHNTISNSHPLKIKIFKEQNQLVISNCLQIKKEEQNAIKPGLNNIKQRYSFFSDEEVEVIKSEDFFSVKIPLIKAE